jgi:predicted transposase/invertase (TIGR01784 family)
MNPVFFSDEDDIINIGYDNVFKAAFTKDTPVSRGALEKLLSAIIERELTILAVIANEPPSNDLRDRQIRFDINCKFSDHELANIEMTLHPKAYEPIRLEYYSCRLFTSQDIRGKDRSYNDLRPTYQIAVIMDRSMFDDTDFLHEFLHYDPARGMSLGGRSRIITMELSKLGPIIKKAVKDMTGKERWAVFFRYSADKSKRDVINEILRQEEGIAMAADVLLTISKDEIERARLMSEYKYEVDRQSDLVEARREGRKEGEKEGKKEGETLVLDLMRQGYTAEEIEKKLREDDTLATP